MALTCNINRRGRLFRSIAGIFILGGGLYFYCMSDHHAWAIGAILLAVFMLFEAAIGWCAIRAMGIKTPL